MNLSLPLGIRIFCWEGKLRLWLNGEDYDLVEGEIGELFTRRNALLDMLPKTPKIEAELAALCERLESVPGYTTPESYAAQELIRKAAELLRVKGLY
jgi:hypothetical protein